MTEDKSKKTLVEKLNQRENKYKELGLWIVPSALFLEARKDVKEFNIGSREAVFIYGVASVIEVGKLITYATLFMDYIR